MRVTAIKDGFYRGRRRAGAVFDVPDGSPLGSWMRPTAGDSEELEPVSEAGEKAQHLLALFRADPEQLGKQRLLALARDIGLVEYNHRHSEETLRKAIQSFIDEV